MSLLHRCLSPAAIFLLLVSLYAAPPVIAQGQGETPRAFDPLVEVVQFAAAPDIVHPVGVTFDRLGRLLVIESHTHFRPKDYKGPERDRIRILEDTDGDGKADRFTTYFEGTVATMAIATHPDGSIYLATRNEILRLRDTKGTGTANDVRRIAFLDTKGDYPHNGLSGLAFDAQGNLYFGMGENLGADYKLMGSDGTTLTGGGEGGNIYWCTADGQKLRRVATGFWNPFGVCRDIFGRIFAVDNDPDAMPPCRLLHVVEGGDYGYQFRYGRSGRHPFQAWDGQLPGTLPMVCGVGEAPCQVLSYESDGLPGKYRGSLLVASWADHRIERYVLHERGASVSGERLPFVQGGKDFRPVGIAVAPDGSLFVSDWVRRDYTLHGQGAIWQVRLRKPHAPNWPEDPRLGLFVKHRPLRDDAAKFLAGTSDGREWVRVQLASSDVRVRASCLDALIAAADPKLDLAVLAAKEPEPLLRAMAVRAMVARGQDASAFVDPHYAPAVRMEAIASLHGKDALPQLLKSLTDADPFLRNAAVLRLGRSPDLLQAVKLTDLTDPMQRIGVLLAWRDSQLRDRPVGAFLADPDPEVRFMAAKWIADDALADYRPKLVEALARPDLNVKLFTAYSSALARIDGRPVGEAPMADYFFARLEDPKTPPAVRVLALQTVPANYPKLTPELLDGLLHSANTALSIEAARGLVELPSPKRTSILLKAVRDVRLPIDARAEAVLGLAGAPSDVLIGLTQDDAAEIREEALRDLVGVKLTPDEQGTLRRLVEKRPDTAPLVARVLGKSFTHDRPPPSSVAGWLKQLDGPIDTAAGRRVFFHPKLAGCYRCHRVDGRGAAVGPDLSAIGRTERRHILESILQPSNQIAPHYQAWVVEMHDGRIRTGMLIHTNLDDYTYLDAQGATFKVNTRDIAETRPAAKSIMPDGLADQLTIQEIRDLMAYLTSRK